MSDAVHIVCPHCQGVNRVPRARLGENPGCGKCHKPLFTGKPLELDEKGLAQHLKSDLPVVVDFWAPWCGPCKMMAPAFAQAAVQLEPQARLVKINTEQNQQIAMRHGIRSIPTLVMFRRGQEHARISGAMDAQGLSSWVRQNM
ncbi:MAG: thiol reductase thioredoxin [Sedimenticola sp.]|nr:MAG: thiol reductase thioredoxin [Sedimenticola sp.]